MSRPVGLVLVGGLLLGGCAGAGDGPGGQTAVTTPSTVEASAVPGPAATGDPTVCSGVQLTSAALVDTGDALQVWWGSDGTDAGADVLWSVTVGDVAYSQAYQLGVRTGPGGTTVFVFDLINATNTYLTSTPEVDGDGVTALFPWSDLGEVSGPLVWSATLSVDGQDLGTCPDPGGDLQQPVKASFER